MVLIKKRRALFPQHIGQSQLPKFSFASLDFLFPNPKLQTLKKFLKN